MERQCERYEPNTRYDEPISVRIFPERNWSGQPEYRVTDHNRGDMRQNARLQ